MPSTIDSYEEDVRSWLAEGLNQQQVLQRLSQADCNTTLRTLQRRVQHWGIQTIAKKITDETIIEKAILLYSHKKLSDSQIAKEVSSQTGTTVSTQQIKSLRLNHGLLRRFAPGNEAARDAHNAQTAELLEPLLDSAGRSWGYR
jgi:hypothetical protein